MKTHLKFWVAAAILLIINVWAITSTGSSLYNGDNSPVMSTLSTSEMSITLLLTLVLEVTTLFYLISKAPPWHTTNELASPQTTASPAKVYTAAQVIPNVKSHLLAPVWR